MPSSFIHSFSYLFRSVRTPGYLFCTLGCNTVRLNLLCCPDCSSLSCWELLWLTRVTLMYPCHCGGLCFLTPSLLYGIARCSRFLCISCPRPRTGCFFRETWLFLLKNGGRNQDLGARCACCSWGITYVRPAQLSGLGKTCVCTLCKYIYLQIFPRITACVYIT